MPVMPPTFRPSGQRTKVEADREFDRRRGSARQRGYTTAWDKAAAGHLRNHPLCVYCEHEGRTTAATLVDHFHPHGGDQLVFWFKPWWVSSCDPCHNSFKQKLERLGRAALDAFATLIGLPQWSDPSTPYGARGGEGGSKV